MAMPYPTDAHLKAYQAFFDYLAKEQAEYLDTLRKRHFCHLLLDILVNAEGADAEENKLIKYRINLLSILAPIIVPKDNKLPAVIKSLIDNNFNPDSLQGLTHQLKKTLWPTTVMRHNALPVHERLKYFRSMLESEIYEATDTHCQHVDAFVAQYPEHAINRDILAHQLPYSMKVGIVAFTSLVVLTVFALIGYSAVMTHNMNLTRKVMTLCMMALEIAVGVYAGKRFLGEHSIPPMAMERNLVEVAHFETPANNPAFTNRHVENALFHSYHANYMNDVLKVEIPEKLEPRAKGSSLQA